MIKIISLIFYLLLCASGVDSFHRIARSSIKSKSLEYQKQKFGGEFLVRDGFVDKGIQNARIKPNRGQESLIANRRRELHSGRSAEVVPDTYESDVKKTALWVGAAVAFSIGIAFTMGTPSAIEFCSGYVLEQVLSVDNLFVFLVLFDYFSVKDKVAQEKILGYGIWGALILRGLFVGAGAVALEQFHQVLLLFALVLGFSSYKILVSGDDGEEEEDLESNAIVKFARRFLKTTDSFDGDNFFTTVEGIKMATPLLLCLVCVELSDVVFAFDSVPAVFGVTQDPFIVYTSNIFAIAGLRSLYGVLSKAVASLEYLEKAVGVVLAVIAAKLGAETFGIELLTPLQSLAVVIGILGTGVALSMSATSKASE